MATLTGSLIAHPVTGLHGAVTVPGDKSISHRALIFAALAEGESAISGLLEGDDVLRTAAAMRALGAEIERDGRVWRVLGHPWRSPDHRLYFGNSGTGARLTMGAVAGAGIEAAFDGDASLRSRPMGRVLAPLRMMGAETDAEEGTLPVTVKGGNLKSVSCKLATASAQVKSAILLAALGAEGVTRVHEPVLCRDHTERMLGAFGVALSYEDDEDTGRFISLQGGQTLKATDIDVPGDPSSAAFIAAAAAITPQSDVLVQGLLMNPQRIGFYETLRDMGADIVFENARDVGGETVADLRVRHSLLHGVDVPEDRAPSMIDEYPILAIVAAYANGKTRMNGIEELRVKESDRIVAVEKGLAACGGDVRSGPDWLEVTGTGQPPAGGARINVYDDHRIAMSFLVLGLAAQASVEIDEASMIATSFPTFAETFATLGGTFVSA